MVKPEQPVHTYMLYMHSQVTITSSTLGSPAEEYISVASHVILYKVSIKRFLK